MKQDKTEIVVVLDRSGSMQSVKADTIGGFNQFLDTQKQAPGEACITLAQFDDVYEVVYSGKPVKEAPILTAETYQPRGSTALYDAICKTIDETGKRLELLSEDARPSLVVFVIQTDGFENCSRTFKIADVNERIARQRDTYKWQFVYLGANQDAIAEASKFGITPGFAMSYGASPTGTKAAYAAVGTNVVAARCATSAGASAAMASTNLAWTGQQRQEQDDEIAKLKGRKR